MKELEKLESASSETVLLSPLPCWKHLAEEDYRRGGGSLREPPINSDKRVEPIGLRRVYPYLSILHPHPASTEVRVEMVSARRYFSYRTGHRLEYQHDATMLREVFTDP